MSYRRNVRAYRRGVARYYQVFEDRPRARLGAIVGMLVAVLGVVAGMLFTSSSGPRLSTTSDAALGAACASSSASPGTTTPAATASATPTDSAAPTTTATSTAAPTVTPTTTASSTAAPTVTPTTTATATAMPTATVAPTMTASASPTSTACVTPSPSASATTSAPAPVANTACDIIVPANPLSAAGLATPFQLTGAGGMTAAQSGCTMANNANLGAFVQATILDPATGALSVYEPLVITQGTTPAAAPVVPTLPAGAVVTIDFGFNGTTLTQVGATRNALRQGSCTDGLNGSVFGQVSFCNGTAFFQAAARAQAQGKLAVPAAGTSAVTGQPCLTTRSFDVVDQDPSDNVTTTYLLTASGQTAQLNAANTAALAGATQIVNGSDNKLLTAFLDPTLGCTPYQVPDLSQDGTMGTSQALNELAAAKDQAAPVALVPENDEMVLVNNALSVQKTNLYRAEIGQPAVSNATNATSSPALFCQNMVNVQTPFLSASQTVLATGGSPVPAVGNNLLTFLANRLSMSFTNLGCQAFGLTDPVTVTLDGNGVATAATFNTTQQKATTTTAGNPPPPGGRRHGRRHHQYMNPSGE
jgi:hypothetical protein